MAIARFIILSLFTVFIASCGETVTVTSDVPTNEKPADDSTGGGNGSSNYPGTYICRADAIGNYGVYRLNDNRYLDASTGTSSWCTARLPSAGQRYFCRQDSIGNFAITRLPDLKVMDHSAGSFQYCLQRVPSNNQMYFCRRDTIGNFWKVRLSDGYVLDAAGSSVESCLETLP